MKFQINGALPLPERDANGVLFTDEIYRKLMEAPIPIYDMAMKARGRGTKFKPIQVGCAQGLIRHQTLRFQGEVEGDFTKKPYIRLIYKYLENQIDSTSLGLLFSDQAGFLKDPNYQLKEIN